MHDTCDAKLTMYTGATKIHYLYSCHVVILFLSSNITATTSCYKLVNILLTLSVETTTVER